MAAKLEKLGGEASAAANLATAKKFIADQEFDFAFLDVNLPDGQGTDLLKERIFPANTAVIVMTAEAGVAGAGEAMRLGAGDYLAKPFEPGELALVIARARRAEEAARGGGEGAGSA